MPGVCRSIPVWPATKVPHHLRYPFTCGTHPIIALLLSQIWWANPVGKSGGQVASCAVNFTFSILQRSPEGHSNAVLNATVRTVFNARTCDCCVPSLVTHRLYCDDEVTCDLVPNEKVRAIYKCLRMSFANTTTISTSSARTPAKVSLNSSCSLARLPATSS